MILYKKAQLVELTRIRLLDNLLIIGVAVLVITLYAVTWQSGEGDYVIIRSQQHAPMIVSLDANRTIDIKGTLGIKQYVGGQLV